MKSNLRNEIKSYIVRSGYTMQEVVDRLSEDYSWSDSVSNLSNKLQRESLRYVEAVQLAAMTSYGRSGGRNDARHSYPPYLPSPSKNPQMPHSPSESPRHFAALRDESVIVDYYTSRRKCIPVPQLSAAQWKGADLYGQKRRD